MENSLNLTSLGVGEKGRIKRLLSNGSMRRRMLDIGLIEDTEVECVGRSPLGDPCAYLIRGAVIAIRSEDCKDILLKNN